MSSQKKDDCFGLPNSGAVAAAVFGILITLWGLSLLFDWKINIMALIAIIFGTLIVAGSLYKITQKKS